MARKHPPFLFIGGLTGRVWIANRYRPLVQDPSDPRPPGLEVTEKFDVTDQFERIAHNLGWTPPQTDSPTNSKTPGRFYPAVCHNCGRAYFATRKPAEGRLSFCPRDECRRSRWKYAKRRSRAR